MSAQKGVLPALRAVGDAYLNGEGVERDFTLASEYYTKASTSGDPVAAYNLSLLYYDGRGVQQDLKLCRSHALKAAEEGILPARVRESSILRI